MGAELGMHIVSSNNLALECSSKGNRNRKLGNFDLDVAQLQGFLYSHRMICYALQRSGNLILAQIHIHNNREAQRNCACACGYYNRVDLAESIHECRNTILCVG